MKTVSEEGEDALIRRLMRQAPVGKDVLRGAGDDCAVVRGPGPGEVLLLKTDAVVEGVHFLPDSPPRLVGRKALARVLSDVAAMGGRPAEALVTLLLPPETTVAWVEAVYGGLHALARRHGVSVVGGETTRGLQRVVSVALTGHVSKQRWIRRSGGKVGDVLFVTGRLGGSIKGRHFTFEPRLEQGCWLAEHFPVHAMMDLSDGLAKDLPRLAHSSGLGYKLDWETLPRNRGCSLQQAWGDGEDYELLLAVTPKTAAKLESEWRMRFPKLPLTRVGRLVSASEGETGPTGGWEPWVVA